MEKIDYEQLRQDLIDYCYTTGASEMDEYGTAMQYFPMAVMDLGDAERRMKENIATIRNASNFTLEQIANELGYNIENYKSKGFGI